MKKLMGNPAWVWNTALQSEVCPRRNPCRASGRPVGRRALWHRRGVFLRARQEIRRKRGEAAGLQRSAYLRHQPLIVIKVVQGHEPRRQDFATLVQVPEIRATVVPAGVTTAAFIDGPGVTLVLAVADAQHSVDRKSVV